MMALQGSGDRFGRRETLYIGPHFQLVSMQAVSARHLRSGKFQEFAEERFTSTHCDLRKGFSSSLDRGGPLPSRAAVPKKESAVGNPLCAFTNLAPNSRYNFSRQGFLCGKQLWIGSACGNGEVKDRLPSIVGTRHTQGTTIVQQTNRIPKHNNGERSTVRTASGRELRWRSLQLGHGGGNIHLPGSSATSRAVAILKNRQRQGIIIDSYTFVEVLKRCLEQKDLIAAKQVHDCIVKGRMDKHPYVANTLLNVYIRCGRLQDARRLFDGLEKKTVVTWSTMIAGYARNHNAEDALEVFNQMRQGGAQPGGLMCLSILKACASPLALKWGEEVHAYIRQAGLESDVRVGTALVQMYAKGRRITEARKVFEKLGTNRDVMTWNVMIGVYAQSGCGVEAYRLFLRMQREGFIPNASSYVSILQPSASAGALDWVKDVHSHALKAGLESDLRVANVLVHMHAKSGSIDEARLIFDRLKTRDVITWSMMIGAYAESGFSMEAYRLLLQMQREGFVPNAITYVNILNASATTAFEWVKEVHSHVLKAGLESDLRVGTALVQMYAKTGSIGDARLIFNRMKKRDVVTWTVMIDGLAQHGYGREALELFSKMNADFVKPDGTTFVAVLSACCHAGLLDDGRRIFRAMSQGYGIEPTVVHYSCMVDLLGRAGHLEEAKLFIADMPVEPDGVIWGALLGACRTHGNVELGELAAGELLKLEPKDASAYVLLSNIYAAAGKWEKVSLVRTMMQERGVRKDPGRSWIEIDKKVHHFVVGDTSHEEAKAIYTELNKLTEKLKAEGYVPDTQLVLQNIEEEEKELALCSHSEKLAIVYGLMHIPHGNPIRIYKNLRVCSDCHTATKFISKVAGREIIARDANRFHHFKDGVCSCGDYW